MTTAVLKNPNEVDSGTGIDGVCQVVLYNDDHNSFDHVVMALVTVFNHTLAIAHKVTMEAHTKGRAIAEVEEAEKATEHVQMLAALGLRAEMEKI